MYCCSNKRKAGKIMKKVQIDVSVVIVNYNTRDILLQCLKTLYQYTKNVSMEVIVVDNDSHDGSVDAVRNAYPQVDLIPSDTNLGFGKANNLGMRKATGRYVCLVNSDVELLEDTFSIMIKYMDDNAKIGVTGPKTINGNKELNPNVRLAPTLWNLFCDSYYLSKVLRFIPLFQGRTLRNFDYDKISDVEVLSGCFMMVRKEALDEVGMFNDIFFIYGEDTDWNYRFLKAGWRVVYYPVSTVIHLEGASSSKEGVRFPVEMEKADLQYWNLHYNWFVMFFYHLFLASNRSINGLAWFLILIIWPFKKKKALNKWKIATARLWYLLFRKKIFQK